MSVENLTANEKLLRLDAHIERLRAFIREHEKAGRKIAFNMTEAVKERARIEVEITELDAQLDMS